MTNTAIATTAKTPRAPRKSKKTDANANTMNMQTATDLNLDNSAALLDGMLGDLAKLHADEIDLSAELEGVEDQGLVIEPGLTAATALLHDDELSDDDLNAIDSTEGALVEIEPPANALGDLGTLLAVTDEDLADLDALPESDAAPAAADAAEPSKKADKAPKAPKEPKDARVTYVTGKASDVLTARVGGKVNEMLILEAADLELDAAALETKQRDLLDMLNARPRAGSELSTQKKVAEKVVMLFGWMKNGGKLNEVMARTFKVLARDGHITSGEKGNLHIELLSKPYSVGTCRAQAGQMMALLPMLKIALSNGEKGRLTLNPNSLIAMKLKADLGL